MVKLDLMNTRLDVTFGKGFGPRIIDSLEDAPLTRTKTIRDFRGNNTCALSIKEYKKYKENVITRCVAIAAEKEDCPPKVLYSLPADYTDESSPNKGPGRRQSSLTEDMKSAIQKIDAPAASFGQELTSWSDTIDSDNTKDNYLFSSEYSNTRKEIPIKMDFYAPTLDIVRDRAHHYEADTIIKRVKSKKLPGAVWSSDIRMFDDQRYSSTKLTGPGYYDVYPSALADKGVQFTAEVAREDPEKAPPPKLKERLRLQRVYDNQIEMECLRSSHRSGSVASMSLASTVGATDKNGRLIPPERKVLNSTKFSSESRWDCVDYKKEAYSKTSGMTLGLDFDQNDNKKIQFSFSSSERNGNNYKSTGGDVDVDVGHLFSVRHAVETSPIKYSAAFNNNCPVGMFIPPTTSPDHIGPGYFGYPNHFKQFGLSVKDPTKPSPTFLRKRPKFPIREAVQNSFDPGMQQFSETHKKGPTFTTEGAAFDKNAELARIVQEKMDQIYPRLAKKKFPHIYVKPARPKSDFYPPRDEPLLPVEEI
jgi:hypothetical protein